MGHDWLRSHREVANMDRVAVLVSAAGDGEQRHAGVLHHDRGKVFLLELAWHRFLRNDPPAERFLWIRPSLDPDDADSVAAVCRAIWKKHKAEQGVPYALRYDSDCFDPDTGDLLLANGGLGLTCATFVLAVFQSVGLPLADIGTWPARADDATWQDKIVRHLRGCDPEHAERVAQQIGCVRFRPEEVAAAASAESLPAAFDFCTPTSSVIVNFLTRWCQYQRIHRWSRRFIADAERFRSVLRAPHLVSLSDQCPSAILPRRQRPPAKLPMSVDESGPAQR